MTEDANYTKLNDVIQVPDSTKNPFVHGDSEVAGIIDHDSLPNYKGGDGNA